MCGNWNENRDSILVAWRTSDNQSVECDPRCTIDSTCFGTVPRFATATGNDAHSKGGEVKFVSGAVGDFRAKTSSSTVDAADTTVSGWRTTDVLGWKRFDCRIVDNTGKPTGTFGDVGPYEHDDGGPSIQVENVGCTSLKVKWIARGASADTLPTPVKYEVFQDGSEVREDTSPQNPGNWENETFAGLEQGHVYEYFVRTTDADGEIAESNKAYNTPCCSPPCDAERPGGGARAALTDAEADFPLGLGHTGANPSAGVGSISWSIPRAQEGAQYDLSLFDVAGRRVTTIAKGTAKAGKYSQEVVSNRRDSSARSGVFFVRLRVGTLVITRTVVVLR